MSQKTSHEFEQSLSDEILRIKIRGALSEASDFPTLDCAHAKQVILDLEEVTYINSFGVQRWVTWLREIQRSFPKVPVHLEKVSSVTVRGMGFVREFVPKSYVFDSVYLSLECSKCHDSTEQLINKSSSTAVLLQVVPCSKCGGELKVDGALIQHLWFWKDPK